MGKSGWTRRFRGALEVLEPRTLLAGDPLAEWRFDSTAGTVLVDSIGTANGTITGSSVYNATATAQVSVMPVWTAANPNQWGTGTRGGALRLFSDTDGALVDAAVAPQVQSVSLWFKADNTNPTRYNSSAANGGSTSGTSVAMPLFETGDSTAGLNIYIYNNRLYVGAWNAGVAGWAAGTFLFTGSNAIVAGRWHHVTVTLDLTAALSPNGLRGYFDGAQFAAGNGATIGGPAAIGIGRTDGTTRYLLGTSGSSVVNNDTPANNNHRGFAGYIDEARVYGETLTATDVTEIRDATAPTVPEEQWLIRDSGRSATIGRFRFAGQLPSEHFVLKWGTGLPANMSLTNLQQNLNRLEMSWDIIVDQAGMLPPRPRNGVTYKVNAYVLDTGLWFVDSGGGTFSGAFAGNDPTNFAALYVSPWALAQSQNPRSITVAPWGDVANTTTTPHEFTHVLQTESQGFANSDYSGPFWETHANFGASLVADYDTGNGRAEVTTRNSINGRYGQRRHRYSLATDFRYEAHPFLNYLADLPGYGEQFVTSGLWSDTDAQGNSKDPWQVLRSNFSSPAEFANVYAAYVASTVTYKALHNGALLSGSPAIPAHNTTQRLFRTYLEPVPTSPGWYQVPEQDTPEQYGANIVKLTPVGRVAGQPHTITVNLDGYTNPGQANGIYATLVAISGTGASVQERFSPTWQSGEMTFELAANETDLYLAVTAIPAVHRNYIWSHPFHGTGLGQKIERFPYRVSLTGAVPVRSEAPVDRPQPSGNAVRHINPDGSTGGWKSPAANVAATAYLGFNAYVSGGVVSGTARIEDFATVTGGTVSGSAIVRGHAAVQSGSVTGSAIVEDYAVIAGGTISDSAHVRGDALVSAGQVRGNALVTDYATIMGGSTVVAGDTVIKGYGVVDSAQMTGNALVASSGLASGSGLVTNMGVQYNGEPASQEQPLMNTQYNNLFAQYDFAAQDNNAVWDTFNTTYGWLSSTPPQWVANFPSSGNTLNGVLQFAADEQFVELNPELSDLHDYTIQMWARWDGTGDVNQRLFEFGSSAQNYMYLQPTSAGGGVQFVISVGGVEKVLQAAAPLAANQWKHVAVTFSGDAVKLSINGQVVAQKSSLAFDPYQVRATYGLLGRGTTGGGFRGAVDSLRVYSDARTSAEILNDVRAIYAGYVPEPDVPPDDAPPPTSIPEPILTARFAIHDNTGLAVQDRQSLPNGDIRNSSNIAPAESASPGGMTSASATYAAYDVTSEGLANKLGADGLAMSTVNGYVYFADAGSPLEQALQTNDSFAVMTRVRRNTDSNQFEVIIGRPEVAAPNDTWTIGVSESDQIVVTIGGRTLFTGVQFGTAQWHDIGFSYTGDSAGEAWAYVYVDGVRKGAFLPGPIASGQPLYLASGAAGANRFRGLYDQVLFWDQPVDDAVFAAISNVPASPLPGDYTRDGAVDAADYVLWRNARGQNVLPGTGPDGTGNSAVDDADYQLWRANFGRTVQAAQVAAIADALFSTDPSDSPDVVSTIAAGASLPNSVTARIRATEPIPRETASHRAARQVHTALSAGDNLLITLRTRANRDAAHNDEIRGMQSASGDASHNRNFQQSQHDLSIPWDELAHELVLQTV